MKQDTAAIESLKAFALSQCVASCHPHDYANNDVYVRFANMCTAALLGEEWATERFLEASSRIALGMADAGTRDADLFASLQLRVIRATNTTRPEVK